MFNDKIAYAPEVRHYHHYSDDIQRPHQADDINRKCRGRKILCENPNNARFQTTLGERRVKSLVQMNVITHQNEHTALYFLSLLCMSRECMLTVQYVQYT